MKSIFDISFGVILKEQQFLLDDSSKRTKVESVLSPWICFQIQSSVFPANIADNVLAYHRRDTLFD